MLKLLMFSDDAVQMIYSPHDDGLYVSRAFHLLMDGGLGPYDSRLLVKLPGISLWLAGIRFLGIPYLLSINLLFAFAGIYFISALNRLNVNRLFLILVFGFYLFNPVSIDHQWYRVMREPLSMSMLVIMLASMLYMLSYLEEKRLSILHLVTLGAVFAFSVMVREEDQLLYALVLMFVGLVAWKYWPVFRSQSWSKRIGVAFVLILPFLMVLTANGAMRSYINRHYGAPLLYDFGQGEFPRLIAAIRSVDSKKDNRNVMVTQEALGKIRAAVPMFAPVIDRLPPPSNKSYSCERFRVCSEWTNGWELFWIKDAASQAGLTPTLPAGQTYFRHVREEIERACKDGRLKCHEKGTGLLPPFELRWTRAYLQEMSGVLKMMTMPGIGVVGLPPPTYPVDVDYGRMYQFVTMSDHYDSQRQSANLDDTWKNYPQNLYLSLKYWLRYPDVANNDVFGPKAGGNPLGAQVHYERHGQHEGRIWIEPNSSASASTFVSPLEPAKIHVLKFYEKFGWIVELLGAVAFILRLLVWLIYKAPLSPLMWVALLFTLFTVLRVLALSYVSVYMGGLDVRLFFTTYLNVLLIAPLIIADLLVVFVKRPDWARSFISLGII